MHAERAARLFLWTLGVALLAATPAFATDYLNESRVIADAPQSTTERFTFRLDKDRPPPVFDLTIEMTQGRAELRVVDPAGRQRQHISAQRLTGKGMPIVGKARAPLGSGLISCGLMILIAAAFVWFWRRRSGVAWRWFWVGAALWTVAVLAKFSIAIPFNRPILEGLKASLPHWAYLTTGTVYGGVMTGITEILFVLIAALIWRQMAATADRAVAIGIGAGAFEAALLGVGAAVAAIAGSLGEAAPAGTYTVEVTTFEAVGQWHLQIHDGSAKPDAGREIASAAFWTRALVGPTERVIAILCHIGSRVLVLLAVARRRWAPFWYGFALLSGVDAVVMFFWITGQVGKISPWLMEALIAPFGLVSIPVTIWCVRHWPVVMPDASLDSQENARQGGGLDDPSSGPVPS